MTLNNDRKKLYFSLNIPKHEHLHFPDLNNDYILLCSGGGGEAKKCEDERRNQEGKKPAF